MKKIVHKIYLITVIFTMATTSLFCSLVSHANTLVYTAPEDFSEFTILDDKGMLANDDYYKREGYKILYHNQEEIFYRADPAYRYLKFILSDDVNFEDVNERVIEIFEEFYPENGLDATYDDMISPDYANNYKPSLYSKTVDDVTTYTVCVSYETVSGIDDERVANAKKYSTDFMKKLNEENLISAFYDFGEVYEVSEYDCISVASYNADVNIDLINNYIDENNIDCTIENVDNAYYVMNFNDDTDAVEQFLIAADIYEATSIGIVPWESVETAPIIICDKNALESLPTSTTPSETTPTISATVTTTQPTTTSLSELTTTTTTVTTITASQPTEQAKLLGDADGDNELTVRDCSFIALTIAQGRNDELSDSADFNSDGEVNVRDAATIAKALAVK